MTRSTTQNRSTNELMLMVPRLQMLNGALHAIEMLLRTAAALHVHASRFLLLAPSRLNRGQGTTGNDLQQTPSCEYASAPSHPDPSPLYPSGPCAPSLSSPPPRCQAPPPQSTRSPRISYASVRFKPQACSSSSDPASLSVCHVPFLPRRISVIHTIITLSVWPLPPP